MINLTDTTFIIPLRIEHADRYNNAETTLKYLNHHLKTNVYIYEVSDDGHSRLDFLQELPNLNISIINDVYQGVFHRMRYLNILLNQVQTPVVCNYDIDVLLAPKTYSINRDSILKGEGDLLYPYNRGLFQIQVQKSFNRTDFLKTFDLKKITKEHTKVGNCEVGHCAFFNTEVYRREGGENENFISWGPEDKERAYRFARLGYKVGWLENSWVYHFEHERGLDSSKENPYMTQNENLFNQILNKSEEDLRSYYRNQQYITQYDNFLHTK